MKTLKFITSLFFALSVLLVPLKEVQATQLNSVNFTNIVNTFTSPISQEVRGIRFGGSRKNYGMNFGGNGTKNTATNNATKNQKTNTNNQTTSPMRSGLLGFLGGMGLMGLLMGGLGVLGGGFLIYMLIAMLLPMLFASFRNRQENSMQENMATSKIFENRYKQNQDEKHNDDARF